MAAPTTTTPRKNTNPPAPVSANGQPINIAAAASAVGKQSGHDRQRSSGSARRTDDSTKAGDTIQKAAERGNTEVVLSFLKKTKALVNQQDAGGHTPLHMAALHNCYDVVDLLLQNNPDFTITDNSGWGLLHFAASGRNEKIFKLLLQRVTNQEGTNQLKILTTHSYPLAKVTAKNEGGNTPLHYLAKNLAGISKGLMQLLIEVCHMCLFDTRC